MPAPILTNVQDVLSSTAVAMLSADAKAVLVDVRTPAEWEQVGRPSLPNTIFLPWRQSADRSINPNFSEELQLLVPDKTTPCYFICKGGGRSREAAETMAALGYQTCFNIADGFEGRSGAAADM